MGYCFMTTKALKSSSVIQSSYLHNIREIKVDNADPLRHYLNDELVPIEKGKDILDVLHDKEAYRNQRFSNKLRANATKVIDVIMSMSKEDSQNINLEAWKQKNVEWLQETFNISPDGKDNVVSVIFHGDESSAHIHALVIPMDEDGEFRASKWRGKRQDMIRLQNSYAKKMKTFGLNRGLQRSASKHKDIKRFYAELDQRISVEKNMEIGIGETLEQYQQRMIEYVKTLQAVNMREVYEKDRQITELKTELHNFKREHSLEETVQFQTQIKELKKEKEKWQGLERTYGTVKNVEEKIQTAQLLNDALVNCENKELRDDVLETMKMLMEQEKERKIREKRIEKQKVFEKNIKKG